MWLEQLLNEKYSCLYKWNLEFETNHNAESQRTQWVGTQGDLQEIGEQNICTCAIPIK